MHMKSKYLTVAKNSLVILCPLRALEIKSFQKIGLIFPINLVAGARVRRMKKKIFLCATSPVIAEYLKFLLAGKGLARHRIIRDLFVVQRRLSPDLFLRVIERAAQFKITDLAALDETYEKREAFQEGRFIDLPHV